jgi:hypothetical protein
MVIVPGKILPIFVGYHYCGIPCALRISRYELPREGSLVYATRVNSIALRLLAKMLEPYS